MPKSQRKLDPLPPGDRDEVAYLVSVVRGERKPYGLSSLENNLIVTEILTPRASRRARARRSRSPAEVHMANKVVVITGASAGIGAALAELLATSRRQRRAGRPAQGSDSTPSRATAAATPSASRPT